MPRGISFLRLELDKKGQHYADRMRRVPRDMSALSLPYHLVVRFRRAPKGMSVMRFSLAKAGQPLVDQVRPALRSMLVVRFSLAKADQPLVVRFRRALRGMSALPEACSFDAFEKAADFC